jgi:hypothetical protein
LFSRRTEINGFRLQVLRTQGLQASINATASISSKLDKAFPFNTNPGKPLISVLLLNKPIFVEMMRKIFIDIETLTAINLLVSGSTAVDPAPTDESHLKPALNRDSGRVLASDSLMKLSSVRSCVV